jgi:two-component system LytT family response regulator
MNKIRAIIIDDEQLARDIIRELVKKHEVIEVVAEGENGIEAVNLINQLNPDLLFLDIQMPELNGFDALKELDAAQLPLIVFTTAYDSYALKAFEASAIDYLLKPFDQERFDSAVGRATRYLHGIDKNFREAERSRVLDHYEKLTANQSRQAAGFIERILVKENKKIIPVPVKDIQVFEADNDYVKLHADGHPRKYLINNSLSNLETVLNPAEFVRIHKSTIIRMDAIAEMHPHFNGEYKIIMKNGSQVKLSRSYKEALQRISGFTVN